MRLLKTRFTGRVSEINKGPAMGSVTAETGRLVLTAAITRQAIDQLQLGQGDQVTAVFERNRSLSAAGDLLIRERSGTQPRHANDNCRDDLLPVS